MAKYFGLASVAVLSVALTLDSARAALVIPVGPQNDVPLSTVTGAWGWTQIYRGDYSVNSVSVASMFSGAGTYVMIGGIRDGSSTIDVLAATTLADFETYTAQNVTHVSNGSEWYFNGGSLGFAGLGDAIIQNEADINGQSERDRLSWHTNGPLGSFGEYGSPAVTVRYGWRSGNNVNLNESADWDKIVFTGRLSSVPEPISAIVWTVILGMGCTMLGRRADR